MKLYNKISILIKPTVYLGFLFIAPTAFAQKTVDTIYDLDVVNIIQSYEPILIGSDKVPVQPDVPKISKNKADEQAYNFSDVKGKINYSAEDIRPIKTAIDQPEVQKFFYLKAGFGNYLTPVVNLALVNPNQTKFRAGLNTDFIFSKAKKPKFQEYFDLKARGFGEYFIKDKALLGAEITTQFDKYHFYADTTAIEKKDIANFYKRFGGKIYIKNLEDRDFDYHANISFNRTSNSIKQKETTIQVDGEGSGMFMQNLGAGANFLVNNISYSDDTLASKNNRFSIAINPYVVAKYKIWKIKLGVNAMLTNGKFYIAPSLQNTLNIYKDYLTMYNEWNSNVKINSLQENSLENPFIATGIFKNQIDEKRTFIGLRGAVSGFYYDFNFSQLVSTNQQLYTKAKYTVPSSDPAVPLLGTFQTEYIHKLKAWNPHFALGYAKGNNYGIKASFDYFIFNKNDDIEIIYKPKIKAGLNAFYNRKEKLYLELNMTAYSKMNYLTLYYFDPSLIIHREVGEIKGVIDLNFSASYFFTKNIGVFIDLNNLSFQKYQRFVDYPTYGFQAIGGIKITY